MRKFSLKKLFVFGAGLGVMLGLFIVSAAFVHAQATGDLTTVGQSAGLPTQSLPVTIAKIVRAILGILGIIAFGITFYAGFLWMTARGNEDQVARAKAIMRNGLIGLVIILTSFSLTQFILSRLLGAANNQPAHCFNGAQDEDETAVDCGGSCGVCGGGGGAGGGLPGSNVLYISSLPASGEACIRNVHPTVIFNREVDITTVNANVTIQKKAGSITASGTWKYSDKKNVVTFEPEGSCGAGENDCLEGNTEYVLTISHPEAIKSLEGDLSLNCALYAGCGPVEFKTGASVDRLPPTISIISPANNSSVPAGGSVPVKVQFSDDNGVQSLALYQNTSLVTSQALSGCKKSGIVDLNWPTATLNPGLYTLQSEALDWAAHRGVTSTKVRVAPFHCFNDSLETDLGEIEKGPPACGGECGSCSGDVCRDNSECASGYCEVGSSGSGKCVDKMRIEGISPPSGAPGSLVTISGVYFGTTPGEVYFTKGPNPNLTTKTDLIKANPVGCGPNAKTWTPNQIIVEVPVGAQSGPIFVVTDKITGRDGVVRTFTDASNDIWGPKLPDFQITSQVRPGLCAVVPGAGVSGDSVQLLGKNFGLFDNAADQVLFGTLKASVAAPDWGNEVIKTAVPLLVDQGAVGVKAVNNGIESNGVRFVVNPGQSSESPLISTITPGSGAKGEYITITGKNFGATLGAVWFRSSAESEAIVADTNFPAGCASSIWRDDQIIVKFPKDKGDIGTSYYVQIKTTDNKITRLDPNFKFALTAGDPAPGICSVSPLSGPIPFPAGQFMTIRGEYFGSTQGVYFWKTGANASTIEGRVATDPANILSTNDTTITLRPPTTINTGPVIVYRSLDKKMSNPASFTILDCVKNGNSCTTAGSTCCATGAEAGFCKPATEMCSGAPASSGYVWRFSTAGIPLVPHVVERCNAATNEGKNIPTPAPSIAWDGDERGDHHNACRTALVTTEFTETLDQSTVSERTVIVNKCSGTKDNNCTNPTPVKLSATSYILKAAVGSAGGSVRHYLALEPDSGRWDDNSWYQVVLKKDIKAASKEAPLALSADRPCEAGDSAYCFVFKTDARDCRMKAVVVTPYSYWTSVLESPIKFRSDSRSESELRYYGTGLSDQRCILMDTSNFDWQWKSENTTYADIFGERNAASAQAAAQGNTVGIGLTTPDNAVNISATARRGAASYTGKSPLTIDLSTPEVVDFWPKCLEACTNAEVAVRFTTTMSLRNLPGSSVGGTVQLLKCVDENCVGTVPVISTSDVYLDPTQKFSVLKIANSQLASTPLEPNTLYQVILSASTTNPNIASNILWSSAYLNNPTSFSKPYNKVFTWRFKTKNQACVVDHVAVVPAAYTASTITDRTTFAAEAYSSPDTCSKEGQKLDPWGLSWQWQSSDTKVATVDTFITKGSNQYCTPSCVRKGGDIPAGSELTPVCGNGIVEAGEDCDSPDKAKGCSLDCRFMGSTGPNCGNGVVEPTLGEACDPKDAKTAQGCTTDCRHAGSSKEVNPNDTTASICGNGAIGAGEDCDQGIAPSTTNRFSKLSCSEKCLHLGSRISTKWCFDNRLTQAGFSSEEYNRFCSAALGQCGNKIQEPSEDPGCDDTVNGWNSVACNEYCLKKDPKECTSATEGCDATGRYKGSSLLYSKPSVCGDGVTGIGENSFCEQNITTVRSNSFINPWALVKGVGLGNPVGEPPTQKTTITAGTSEKTKGGLVSGTGTFAIQCGYKTDQECQVTYGAGYGVGSNSCCYARAKSLSTYPANNATNVCPNTYLEATFDSPIDAKTLPGNVIIARGASSCAAGQEEVTSLVAFTSQSEQGIQLAWYQKIWHWVKNLWGSPVEAAPTRWCAGGDFGTAEVIPSDTSTTTSRVQVKLDNPLANTTEYAIILKEGVKTTQGVSIGKATGKPLSWRFTTAPQICEINFVTVSPAQWSFSRAGATTTLQARASTASGAFIQGIPGSYDWNYIWGPTDNPFVTLSTTSSSLNTITAQNRNGEQDIRAAAHITANKFTSATGTVATGRSHVIVFLCENPWPPKDLYLEGKGPYTIFPFEDKAGNNDGFDIASNTFNNTPLPASAAVTDGYFNFSSYYCADKGVNGTFDDLPYLRGTVQVDTKIVSASSSLKRFIFTNTQNSDAIGVQVFPNPTHLTAEEWYSNAKANGGQGFAGAVQKVKINGYDAVSDGNNVYVDALNYSSVTKNLYSNIYLFSINADASPDTKAVFEQFMQNLRFNSNLTNYGYCGKSAENPDFITKCQSDLDCSGGQVCSAAVDKIKRNYERLRGLKTLENALGTYYTAHDKKFPDLSEGTLLKGQNLSVWPSWTSLGTLLGVSLPTDPINELGKAGTCSASTNRFCTEDSACPPTEKCVLHEAQTGWSTVDRRFSFACATSSYAYRYIAESSNDYIVRAHFETPGVPINNFDAFTREFVTTSRFITTDKNGICNQDQEISTISQGRCGDGIVNASRGEECDPPGYTRYGSCTQSLPGVPGSIKVDVCTNACTWAPSSTPYISCNALSVCGNGKVESGEQCDEGVLNGRYNHCTTKCSLPPAEYCGDGTVQKTYETCDIKDKLTGKKGVCVDGATPGAPCDSDSECKDTGGSGGGSSFTGICRLIEDTKVRYARNQKDSCNFDCQSYGPYCGDGVVEAQFGEECDGNQSCSVGGAGGTKVCTAQCKWGDSSAGAWWKFEDAFVDRAARDTKFFDAVGSSTLSCTTDCPTFAEKVRGDKNAFKFDGTHFATTAASSQLAPTTALTVEAWVNPSAYHDWMRILEKGGYLRNGGYTLQFNGGGLNSHTAGLVVWDANSKTATGINTIHEVPLNQWTHLAATYQRQGNVHTFKIYLNGKLDNSYIVTTSTALLASTNDQLVVGRAVSGGTRGQNYEGLLSDVKVYTRALTDAEVENRYNEEWVCSVPTSGVATLPGGAGSAVCGDGKINEGEACDRGAQNGIKCSPAYGKSCTYCSGDCRNVIDVTSQEFCGNGVVEGPEVCDTDPTTNIVYSSMMSTTTKPTRLEDHQGYEVLSCAAEPQETYSYKTGTKSCTTACSMVASNCTICGIDEARGVIVKGGFISAAEPSRVRMAGSILWTDDTLLELFLKDKKVGHILSRDRLTHEFTLLAPDVDPQTKLSDNPKLAKLSTNTICSSGDPHYQLRINSDDNHIIDFPIVASPSADQYTIIASPVIRSDFRPKDVRVVVSWMGGVTSFVSGILSPRSSSITVEGTSFSTWITGPFYFTYPPEKPGIWYHGVGNLLSTSVESFTLDTSALKDLIYAFYVRVPQSKSDDPGMENYRTSAKLRVDLYYPENDFRPDIYATKPAQTIFLNAATPSSNPSASYWHVFNLRRPLRGGVGEGDVGSQIVPVNRIVSDTSSF